MWSKNIKKKHVVYFFSSALLCNNNVKPFMLKIKWFVIVITVT